MVKSDQIEAALNAALRSEAVAAYEPAIPLNRRSYNCSVNGCAAPAYAGQLCNAHYIRMRNGKDMSQPIRARHIGGKCKECGEPSGGKGGWSLCKRHYRSRRRSILRAAAVELMGGKCLHCEGVFPLAAYDFHHVNSEEKERHPSDMLDASSIRTIAEEIAKCVLLCANCHRVEHSHDR